MTHKLHRIIWIALLLTLGATLIAAQDSAIIYGETVSGSLSASADTATWRFDANARDMFDITVRHIGGQLSPRVRLLDPNGAEIPVSVLDETPQTQTVRFDAGLPAAGAYQIQVTSVTPLPGGIIENEYSLSLTYRGTRRASVDEGVPPLPTLGSAAAPMPDVQAGGQASTVLELPVYGTRATASQPDERLERNRYVVRGGNFRIDWETQGLPSDYSFTSLGFFDNGVGFTTAPIEDSETERTASFFADKNFQFIFDNVNKVWTMNLFESNVSSPVQTIVTDFRRLQSVQSVNGLVSVITVDNQRLLFSGPYIDIVTPTVGPNAEPVTEMRIDPRNNGFERSIYTDLVGYHTLWYDHNTRETRVLYDNNDTRLFLQKRDYVKLFARNSGGNPQAILPDGQTTTLRSFYDITFLANLNDSNANKRETLRLTIDPYNLGDITVSPDMVNITALDRRQLQEPLVTPPSGTNSETVVRHIYTENGAIQVTRSYVNDIGLRIYTYRTLYTDGTEIETQPVTESTLDDPYRAPTASDYVPRGQNNYGANPQPTYPSTAELFPITPVNPINGNFYYHATDMAIPSHTLALDFQRHYNSLAGTLTPTYMLASPNPYIFGRMGDGWRHSYQYDLDITQAPNGRVVLVMPDGSRHRFRVTDDVSLTNDLLADLPQQDSDNSNTLAGLTYGTRLTTRWRSETLQAWTLERDGGITGDWRGITPEGTTYTFDRLGRLLTITDKDNRSLVFSPAPTNILANEEGSTGGFTVTEPYGRRLEVYSNAGGAIQVMRDPFGKPTRYAYNGNLLGSVAYTDSAQSAQYSYLNGQLIAYNDNRSPYHPNGQITYTEDGTRRVASFTENPTGATPRPYLYAYNDQTNEAGQRSVTRSLTLANGQRHGDRWQYDLVGRLREHREGALLDDNGTLAPDALQTTFEYTADNLINTYGPPTRARFSYNFNPFGYMVSFKDPLSATPYALTYNTDTPDRLFLQEITFPNTGRTVYAYDLNGNVATETRTVRSGNVNNLDITTRYEHDAFGRTTAILKDAPANSIHTETFTAYEYDTLGYLVRITEGGRNPNDPNIAEEIRDYELQFNPIGQLQSVTDPLNKTTALSYYPDTNRVQQILLPDGNIFSYEYDANGLMTRFDDRGQVTNYLYNDLLQLQNSSQTVTVGGEVRTIEHQYAYNLLDNLTQYIDPMGRNTLYTYDVLGNLTHITLPTGEQVRYRTLVDAEGTTTNHVIEREDGTTIRYGYNALGNITSITRTNGNFLQVFSVEYDVMGRPVTVSDGYTGRALQIAYDLIGRPIRTVVAGEFATRYTYDNLDNLIAVQEPSPDAAQLITRYAYDPFGNLTHKLYPKPNDNNNNNDNNIAFFQQLITAPDERFTYDALDNLTTATINPDAGLDSTTRYTYDDLSRLIAITQPGNLDSSFTYDAHGNLTSATSPQGNTRNAVYDELNRMISSSIGANQLDLMTYTYDDASNLINIALPAGRSIEYTYDSGNNIIVENRGGDPPQLTLYDYDGVGRVASTTNARGYTTQYNYDRGGDLSQIIDPLGNRQTYVWRGGRLAEYIDQRDQQFNFNTDNLGRITTIRDIATQQNVAVNTQFIYADNGRIAAIEQGIDAQRGGPAGDTARYTYDTQGRVVEYTETVNDSTTATYRVEYDELGRVSVFTQPPVGGQGPEVQTRYEYDDAGRVTAIIYGAHLQRANERRTETFSYDRDGNIIEHVTTDGTVYQYIYNELGLPAQIIEAANTPDPLVFTYTYDDASRLVTETNPDGSTVNYTYNLSDTVSSVTYTSHIADEAPIVYEYEYDELNNISQIILPGTKDPNLVGIDEGFQDQVIELTYDALGRPVRYVDAMDQVYAYTYDERSNLLSISDPLGSLTRYSYDPRDRVTEVQFANGARIEISYNTTGGFDGLELPDADQDVNTLNDEVRYQLDRNGALVSVTHNQRPQSAITYTADAYGNITSRSVPGDGTTAYTYNPYGDLLTIAYPSGTALTRTYDQQGNLTQIQQGRESVNLAYDDYGRVVRAGNTSFTYDIMGNITRRDFGGDIGSYTYTYDGLGRPVRVTFDSPRLNEPAFIELTYDLNGWRTEVTRSNGVQTQTTYNKIGLPTLLTHINLNGSGRDRFLDRYAYRYDAVGNMIRATRNIGSETWTTYYSYDIIHQLIDERWLDNINKTRYKVNIRYDDAGNRIEEVVNNDRTLYIYNAQNQLVGIVEGYDPENTTASLPLLIGLAGVFGFFGLRRDRRRWAWMAAALLLLQGAWVMPLLAQSNINPNQYTHAFTYDEMGRLATMTERNPDDDTTHTLTLAYDAESRLVSVKGQRLIEQADGTFIAAPIDVSLSYNIQSQVTRWDDNPNDRRAYEFAYDGPDRLSMTNTENREATLYFTPFPGETWMQVNPDGSTQWMLPDALGNVRRMSNADGTLAGIDYDYSGFGQLIDPYDATDGHSVSAPPVAPQTLFNSGLYDPSLEMYHMGLRTYDPNTGRFIQRDPVRQDIYGTLYTYGRNRPTYYNDPQGTTPQHIFNATNAPNLAQSLRPPAAPAPLMPNIPAPPSIHREQAAENFRALTLAAQISTDINRPGAFVSPLLDTFYTTYGNTASPALADMRGDVFEGMMGVFEADDTWDYNPQPTPNDPVNALSRVHHVAPHIARSYVSPLMWSRNNGNPLQPLTPTLPHVPLQPEAIAQQEALLVNLREVSLIAPITSELAALADSGNVAPDAPPTRLTVELPDPQANPDVQQDYLSRLQADQKAFAERLLSYDPR